MNNTSTKPRRPTNKHRKERNTVIQNRTHPMKQKSTCHLCGHSAILHRSHIVPAFIFRWLCESSATGHLRERGNIDLRIQDGMKERWLCTDCEQRLSKHEGKFAENLFYPIVEDRLQTLTYGPWLLDFCVSLS